MLDGIDLTSFSKPRTVRELYEARCGELKEEPGVYLVIRDTKAPPSFRMESNAGWFKGLCPSYPIEEVERGWVQGARVVYVGMTRARRGLKGRIWDLIRFAYGQAVGHRGGRMLWHLHDWDALKIRWKCCPNAQADALESKLIEQFRWAYRKRPFANRAK